MAVSTKAELPWFFLIQLSDNQTLNSKIKVKQTYGWDGRNSSLWSAVQLGTVKQEA